MNCPNCNTPNKPGSQYCIQCGEPLQVANQPQVKYGSAKEVLGIYTLRTLLALIGLAILNTILTGLSFIEELDIPDFDMTAPTLITILIYLVAITLLIQYTVTLKGLWPRAYPRYQQADSLFNAILYVIVLSMVYRVFKPFIFEFTFDTTPLLIVQLILIAFVLVILGRASIFVYQMMPVWISTLKESITPPQVQIRIKEEEAKTTKIQEEEG